MAWGHLLTFLKGRQETQTGACMVSLGVFLSGRPPTNSWMPWGFKSCIFVWCLKFFLLYRHQIRKCDPKSGFGNAPVYDRKLFNSFCVFSCFSGWWQKHAVWSTEHAAPQQLRWLHCEFRDPGTEPRFLQVCATFGVDPPKWKMPNRGFLVPFLEKKERNPRDSEIFFVEFLKEIVSVAFFPNKTSFSLLFFRCPWIINVQPGQTVNLTLLTFDLPQGQEVVKPAKCQMYAVVRDRKLGSDVTVCKPTRREKAIFHSATNQIQVQIVANMRNEDMDNFIIRYHGKHLF